MGEAVPAAFNDRARKLAPSGSVHKSFPFVGSLLGALFIASGVSTCAAAMQAPTAGLAPTPGVARIFFAILCISWHFFVHLAYGLPPKRVMPRFYWALGAYALGMLIFLLLGVSDKLWWLALVLPFGGFLLWVFVITVGAVHVIARRTFRQLPELDPVELSQAPGPDASALLAHATDIHITKDDATGRFEDRQAGGQANLPEWLRTIAASRPSIVAFTGDVTDTGDAAEWSRVERILSEALPAGCAVVMAPGNHDLVPAYGGSAPKKMRQFIAFFGDRHPGAMSANGTSLKEVANRALAEIVGKVDVRAEQEKQSFIRAYASYLSGGPDKTWARDSNPSGTAIAAAAERDWHAIARNLLVDEWYERFWFDLFPLCVDAPDGVTTVLILNSVRPEGTIGASALGSYGHGQGQLDRLADALFRLGPSVRNVVLLTHHAPFRRPGEWRFSVIGGPLRETYFLTKQFGLLAHAADEARRLHSILARATQRHQSVNFFLCCGHRHRGGCGRLAGAWVTEGPSLAETAIGWLVFATSNDVRIVTAR